MCPALMPMEENDADMADDVDDDNAEGLDNLLPPEAVETGSPRATDHFDLKVGHIFT